MDTENRKIDGYYYTPQFITKFIIRSIDDILKEENLFQLTNGIANSSIKILDVATGIGSYISEIYKYVLDNTNPYNDKQYLLNNHLLTNVFGFDIEPNAIENAQLNLDRILKTYKLTISQNQNFNLHCLDTLAELDKETVNLKVEDNTFVILGTPPLNNQIPTNYNKLSSLLKDYISDQSLTIKYLHDSNIQFIRFAHYKLSQVTKGIIAFLCNDTFLAGKNFHEMRKSLYIDFDKIYIIKLQNSAFTQNNFDDEVIFPIKIGLSIVFFIKTERKISKEISFFSLYENGIHSNNEKIEFLNNESVKSIKWNLVPLNSKFTFVDNRLIPFPSENVFASKLDIKPLAIKQIYIKNFKGINNLQIKLPIDCQWIFLTGENASGKTSILQAIVLGLYDKNGYELQKLTKFSINKHSTQIAIEVFKNHENIINDTLNNDNFYQITELAAYSPIRIKFTENEKNTNPAETFFTDKPEIYNIEEKLKKLSESDFDFFVSIYKQLIPNLTDIKKDNSKRFKTEIVYKEENNKENIKFSELAMGMRSIIGFIGDFLIKLTQSKDTFETNEIEGIEVSQEINIKDTKVIEGIVIIDEFDNHLHPKWQRELVEKLTELFPKVQFIVSTHSPIPLLGAPKNSVFIKVNRDKEKGITAEKLDIDISTLSPNSILTSPIFGFQSLIPEMHDGTKFIQTESDYNKILKNEKEDKEIEEYLSKDRKERFNKIKNSDLS